MKRRTFFKNIAKNSLNITDLGVINTTLEGVSYTLFEGQKLENPLCYVDDVYVKNQSVNKNLNQVIHPLYSTNTEIINPRLLECIKNRHHIIGRSIFLFVDNLNFDVPDNINGVILNMSEATDFPDITRQETPILFMVSAEKTDAIEKLKELPNPLPAQHDIFIYTGDAYENVNSPAFARLKTFIISLT